MNIDENGCNFVQNCAASVLGGTVGPFKYITTSLSFTQQLFIEPLLCAKVRTPPRGLTHFSLYSLPLKSSPIGLTEAQTVSH